MKYRKKPVEIDAYQFLEIPQEVSEEFKGAVCWSNHCKEDLEVLPPHIHTLEGIMTVSPNDWIIKGVKGEFYPCKPDIFEMTYEKI